VKKYERYLIRVSSPAAAVAAASVYLMLLQVYDIATGEALLHPPIAGCAGDVVWWGSRSDLLLYTVQVSSSNGSSNSSSNGNGSHPLDLLLDDGSRISQLWPSHPHNTTQRSITTYLG
jgi:hypothetical protein